MKFEPLLAYAGAGFFFAVGVGFYVAFVMVIHLALTSLAPHNSSDGHTRSGFQVRTDHLTGCEYLESPAGFLTLRRDRGLKPICVPPG